MHQYNQTRRPPIRPQAANITDLPQLDEQPVALGPDLVDVSVDSGILQVATNIDRAEEQLQEDLIKQTVELQDFYEDDPSQYASEDIKTAIASELFPVLAKRTSMVKLTSLHYRHIIKTRWVIRPRPSSTSVDDVDDASGPLKARFVAT